jgi:hypothetical protein
MAGIAAPVRNSPESAAEQIARRVGANCFRVSGMIIGLLCLVYLSPVTVGAPP